MPQLDALTFAPIIFSIFILYVGGYLMFNITTFLPVFNKLKLAYNAWNAAIVGANCTKKNIVTLLDFPWILV